MGLADLFTSLPEMSKNPFGIEVPPIMAPQASPILTKLNAEAAQCITSYGKVLDRAEDVLKSGPTDELAGGALYAIWRAKDELDGEYTRYTTKALEAAGKKYPYELKESNFWEKAVLDNRMQIRALSNRAEGILQSWKFYERDREAAAKTYAERYARAALDPTAVPGYAGEIAEDAYKAVKNEVREMVDKAADTLKKAGNPLGNAATIAVVLLIVAAFVWAQLK